MNYNSSLTSPQVGILLPKYSIFSLSRSFRILGICRVYPISPQDALSRYRFSLLPSYRFLCFSFDVFFMIFKIEVNKLINSIIRKLTDHVSGQKNP